MSQRPNVLIASGLDPSGGAGLIADTRVAELFGVRPVGVATTLTVQDTFSVRSSEPVPIELLREQLVALLSDIELAAVKIGAIPSPAHAEIVADALALTGAPAVWDPVLAPSRGSPLFTGDPLAALRALAPHLELLTPNLDEAAALGVDLPGDAAAMQAAARALSERAQCAVLIKGGHLAERAIDVLASAGAIEVFDGDRHPGESPHGTGCALSTAIACARAAGDSLVDATRRAKAFVAAQIATPARPGRGGPCAL